MKITLLIPLLFSSFILVGQHPQDFLEPLVWLRADQMDTDGTYWNNVSNKKINAYSVEHPVSIKTSAINYNNAVFFNGNDGGFTIPIDLSKTSQLTIIAVYNTHDTLNERSIWSARINAEQEVFLSTQRAGGPQSVSRYSNGIINMPVVNTTLQYWGKPAQGIQQASFTLGYYLQDSLSLKPFHGEIAEFIVFDRMITGVELHILESYLSIKYGTTLQGADYINVKGRILWNFEENIDYSYAVAAIGRDDDIALYQKQSMNTEEPGLLVIGAGEIAEDNQKNISTFRKDNYLFWGMNDQDLNLERSTEEIYPYVKPILNRKWKMTAYGNMAEKIPTEVKLNAAELLGHTNECYLVMDRSGTGDFALEDIEYIPATHVSESGIATFKDLQWNTNAVPDIFTFSFGMNNGVYCSQPVCHDEATGIVYTEIMGGTAPYHFTLSNDSTGVVNEWSSNSRFQQVDYLHAGQYQLFVTDADGNSAKDQIIIYNPEQFTTGLEDEYVLKLGESIVLDAGSNLMGRNVEYYWEHEEIFFAEGNHVQVSVPGVYTVTLNTDKGCQVTDTILVKAHGENTYHYRLYPNPSSGDYKLEIILSEKSPVTITVYNALGMMVKQFSQDASTYHSFSDYLNEPGLYILHIDTELGKETLKLIIRP